LENNKNLNWITEDYIPQLVSVIIPTYNRQAYLPDAVKSVLAQTYRPIECIIVDDGSIDDTKAEVDRIGYQHERFSIKYLYQTNSGSQIARNKGTRACTGEFIQYLDSDDLLYPDKIQKQVTFLENDPYCDGVFGDWEVGLPDNKVLVEAGESDEMIAQLLTVQSIHTLAMLYRRKIVNRIGEWDVNIKRNQEIDFQVTGLIEGAFYKYQPQNCGLWRTHAEKRIANTTGGKEMKYFFEKWEGKLLSHGLFSETIKKNIATIYFWSIHQSVIDSKADKLNVLLEAARLYPDIAFINTGKMKILRRIFGLKNTLRLWLLRNKYVALTSPVTKSKLWLKKSIRNWLVKNFKRQIGDKKFCIISNDCWGAELYKLLDRPFNTPFVGLMLMSPCYIKMLQKPSFYLSQTLVFKKESRYPEMQEIESGKNFPLATLGESDIEIHFLHYKTIEEAKEKWNRRVSRIDWENLFVKYDCGKDYASVDTVHAFNELEISNKLIFGKEDFGFKEVTVIRDYPKNAVKQFRSCFLTFSPVGWISGDKEYKSIFQKFIGKLAFKYL
jgi:uncharacterized protein (DUF1919 family)